LCAIKIWSRLPPAGPLPNNRLQATVGGLGIDAGASGVRPPRLNRGVRPQELASPEIPCDVDGLCPLL